METSPVIFGKLGSTSNQSLIISNHFEDQISCIGHITKKLETNPVKFSAFEDSYMIELVSDMIKLVCNMSESVSNITGYALIFLQCH